MPLKKLAWASAPDRWSVTLLTDPVPHNRRTLSAEHKRLLELQISEWTSSGTAVKVLRGFPSQPVFVKKKNGKTRVCGDFRPLNDVTEEFDWPLPRLQDMRHHVRGFTWFASIDLKDAFHRIHIPPDLRKWVSISTPWGLFSFTKMTFGLKNAPSYFQRYLDHLLQAFSAWAIWYQDDILVLGHTAKEVAHRWMHLKKVLEKDGNLVNTEKSEGPTQKITWCGLTFTPEGLTCGDPLSKDLPTPYNKKDRQSALGWLNYFRDYIPNFSHYTELITPNQHNQVRSVDYEEDWSRLLEICAKHVDLSHWTPGKDAQLFTDASGYAMGGILVQQGKVIALWSKKLNPAQTRYSATDREHLALATSAEKFRVFLQDRKVCTTVYTDHSALLNRDWKDLRPIQVRWVLTIRRYILRLQHIAGQENPADFLSRKGMGG